MKKILLCLLLTNLATGTLGAEPPRQFADIGDLALVSGEMLRDVRIAYRTAGELEADRSNAILFPTWFTGTSGELFRFEKIGPGLLADTDRFYVIAVDSLGNGVSTSPSNSERQPGPDFPRIAIDDMVNAAPALLTKPRHRPPACRDGHLDGRHADLPVGRPVSGFHGQGRADRRLTAGHVV